MRKIFPQFVLFVLLVRFGAAPLFAAQGPDIPIGGSPSLGPANAPVTIFEFIDFQ
jgi:hypothetical protein